MGRTMLDLLLAAIAGVTTTQPTQAIPAFTCPAVAGAEAILPPGPDASWPIVILGEVHGTAETPALFGDLVCNAALKGPVNVHLEWANSLSPQVDAYLGSDGTEEARGRLLDHYQFNPGWADGRSSQAMLSLLERLRLLKAAGADLRAFCFQPDYAVRDGGGSQFYREQAMAHEWVTTPPDRQSAFNLVLVGNYHAARQPRFEGGAPPAASYLKKGDAILLNPLFAGGEAWNMQGMKDGKPDAGPHKVGNEIKAGEIAPPRGIVLRRDELGRFDGTFSVGGPFTASPPVKKVGE